MEDAANAVVPLRPGFDIQIRGFNRIQVIEHIELLEDQLKLTTIDRNEAAQLNCDLRRLYDDARHDLDQADSQLKRIESSNTGLPVASQRVQNMLSIAEEEVQTLRDQAMRHAEILRGSAETDSRELIEEAEATATELRTECAQLVTEMESRRDQMRREHVEHVRTLREREQRMRQAIRDEYKKTMARAQEEADDLLARTQRQCGQWNAETDKLRLDALEEIQHRRTEIDELRQSVLEALDRAGDMVATSSTALRGQPAFATEPNGENGQVAVPEQRDDVQTFTVPLERQHTNGIAAPDPVGLAETGESARRN